MRIGICSYSFHRLLAAGKQDVFAYIATCRELGCTQLDPWNAHLPRIAQDSGPLDEEDERYLADVRRAADAAGLPFGTLAVDGANVYEPTPRARAANRARALRHLEAAAILGASQVRIDAGGPDELTSEVFEIIQAGYRDLIDRAARHGIQVLVENHWGPTTHPDQVLALLEEIPGLGLLFDSHNWRPELRDQARRRCAPHASAVHLKTFQWDAQGNETSDEGIESVIAVLEESGYAGPWGIESTPLDGDEITGARNTVRLLKRLVAKAS